jgi:hypothetical protein
MTLAIASTAILNMNVRIGRVSPLVETDWDFLSGMAEVNLSRYPLSKLQKPPRS